MRNNHEAAVWVEFACAAMARNEIRDTEQAAQSADSMLAEYRKRVEKIGDYAKNPTVEFKP